VRSFQVPATPRHLSLAAEFAFGADLAGHARHFRRKAIELIDHRIDGVLQLEDFALHVNGNLFGEVAIGNRRRDFRDVADLAGEVRGHEVHIVGEIFPGASHSAHLGLTAELAFSADLAGHTSHLRGKAVELIHHRVDRVFQFEDFALHVDGDLARQIAFRDRGRHPRQCCGLGR